MESRRSRRKELIGWWSVQRGADQQVLNGSLPPRALRLVTDWAKLHTAELQADWDLAQALAPLVPIDPLP
jgi:hypothetical protein